MTEGSPQEPAEHLRFRGYLARLHQVTDEGEEDLLREVLADPDQQMAGSAVVRYLDRRAAELRPGTAYAAWAERMTRVTAGHPFPTRRLREWTLLRAVATGEPWTTDTLLEASDWLQLTVAAETSDPTALGLLAAQGRTRRIRNAARAARAASRTST